MTNKKPAPPFVPPPGRPPELPFDNVHMRIEEAIEKLKEPTVRNAGRNSLNHLRKAWKLHPVDSEMSLFRAITAEEEAATAVIRALKLRGYPNADRLKERHHPHKASIWPFIRAAEGKFAEKKIPMPNVALRTEGEPRVEMSIDIGKEAGLDRPLWGTPDEPFNFSMWSDRTGPFKLHDFSEELASLATIRGARNIAQHVAKEANLRNRLLYASMEGIPSVAFDDDLLIERRKRVIVMLVLTIAILQTTKHQLFLVQCLDALLRAVQGFQGDPADIPTPDITRERVELVQQPDGTMKLSLVRPTAVYRIRYILPPETEEN